MKMSNEQYGEYVKKKSPRSKLGPDLMRAFLVGGAICTLGQLLTELYLYLGAEKDAAGTLCSVSLIALSALLTGFGVYDRIAKFGGAGSLVPITGFANAVASPAIESRSEGLIVGTAAKMFSIAGPVIVYGTAASVIYGLILWACSQLAA